VLVENPFSKKNKNALLLFPLAIITFGIFCLPFVALYGGIYAALIGISIYFLWMSVYKNAMIFVLGLHIYQVVTSFITTNDINCAMSENSELMVQSAAALILLVLCRTFGLKILIYLATAVAITAVISVICETHGLDLQAILPSKYHDATTYVDSGYTYAGQDSRIRGVYGESSALGAVLGGISSMFFTLLFCKWKYIPWHERVIMLSVALVSLICLTIVLTKAGFIILFIWFVVFSFKMATSKGLKNIATTLVLLLLFSSLTFFIFQLLPDSFKDYLNAEVDSFLQLSSGGSEKTSAGKGAFGRTGGYEIAIKSLILHPLGADISKVEDVVTFFKIPLSEELEYLFNIGVFGLKNALCNIIACSGFVGILFMILFIRSLIKSSKGFSYSINITADIVCVQMGILLSILFMLIVEAKYFYLGFTEIMILSAQTYTNYKIGYSNRKFQILQ
jgi:hypothetical protein